MHHAIAKRKAKWAFERLSARDIDALLGACSDHIHHEFAGHHCLGGVRDSKQDFRVWLRRLLRLFPKLSFEPRSILVQGLPWDMVVCVLWTDQGLTADGESYENHGAHELRIRWGKLVSLRAHLDTQHLERVLDRMARNGVAEAAAAPIGEVS